MKYQRIFLLAIIAAALLLSTACSKTGKDALTALKKVQAATQSGVKYDSYSQLVNDAQAAFNEDSAKLSDGELKKELTEAMNAYNDAKWAWGVSIQAPSSSGIDSFIVAAEAQDLATSLTARSNQTRAKELFRKYSLITDKEEKDSIFISTGDLLQAIWKAAEEHVNNASKLL